MWVGIGGIAGKYQNLGLVYKILERVKSERPDIKIHALGLTESVVNYTDIVDMVYSTESVGWALSAKMKHFRLTGNWNDHVLEDPRNALKFAHRMEKIPGIERMIYGTTNAIKSSKMLVGNSNSPN